MEPDSHSNQGRTVRRLVVAGGLALALLCAGLHFLLRAPQPTYHGKTAAAWFKEFQKASDTHWKPLPSGARQPPGTRYLDMNGLAQDRAADGLRALGTNAAVYLGSEFSRNDGILSRNYASLYFSLPPAMRALLPLPRPMNYVRLQISWAFETLGPSANAAAPSILATLRHGDPATVSSALGVLQRLQFDRALLDPILDTWSRGGDHATVLHAITALQLRTSVAARCLARGLSLSAPTSRRHYIYELGQCREAAVAALPELTAELKDPDDEVRYGAANALENIGSPAVAAIPALIQATNDPSVMVQRASARALEAVRAPRAK